LQRYYAPEDSSLGGFLLDLDDAELTAATADLCASPAWYPLKLAGDRVSVIHLEEADYAAASFLDERLLGFGLPVRTVPLSVVAAAAARLAPRAHYLFHVGHVGSTLISRLIGARSAFFALREPSVLRGRSRAEAADAPLPLSGLLALLSRTWRSEQRAVIKLTSIVSEIGREILAASDGPQALLVYARPLAYLRGIFGGPNSRRESQVLAPDRLRRLLQRHPTLGSVPPPRFEGEWIAMSWLCEMSALAAIARSFATKVHWVDFDEFLAAPTAGLAAIFGALSSPAAPAEVEGLLAGPIMSRYSKAPEHAYDAQLRREVLAGADLDFRSEIRRGMTWLGAAGQRDAEMAAILEARG
jgi:hypothetical protein